MRFLFSFTGGTGHFMPTTPFAHALTERGHSVSYACQESMVEVVRSRGWRAVDSGGATLLAADQRRPLAPLNLGAEREVVRTVFAGKIARERAERLLGILEDGEVDVVVRDEMDFGAAVAAEASGLPHAAVIVIAAGGFYGPELIAEPLAQLRSEYGLADDGLTMLHRHLTLVPAPPSFRNPRDPLPPTAHHVQPAVLQQNAHREPRTATTQGRPMIYFTLGTIFHQESGDLFQRVLSGIAGLDAEILVTIGREIDPDELGPQPSHVRIERFVDPAEILSRSELVVSHGGSGTVVGALAFGVPQIVLPMGADQPLNAERCQALGVGAVLDASAASAGEIGAAARTVLETSSYQDNALRIRDEIRALPDTGQAATLLEDMVPARQVAVCKSQSLLEEKDG